jgi:E3 ubiquitin-protein ligase UBR7
LVELFNKRNFTCDCGTLRFLANSPCALRLHPETNTKGGVHSETPDANNQYNQNFKNQFCGCECDYDPFMQKGTMFQCLGLGTTKDGGCGEDWWHPGCIVGIGANLNSNQLDNATTSQNEGLLKSIAEVPESGVVESGQKPKSGTAVETVNRAEPNQTVDGEDEDDEDPPLPPGFPPEDDFEGFICYKCVDANPWIKRYAGTSGFLNPVFRRSASPSPEEDVHGKTKSLIASALPNPKKRKADDENLVGSGSPKRLRDDYEKVETTEMPGVSSEILATSDTEEKPTCKAKALAAPPLGQFSLFLKSDFRDHFCRCSDCFADLSKHPQLLEIEEVYEPPLSESGDEPGVSTEGGSIYDRGESALKNVDRVRAIEGVMAYNHLKEKLRPLFEQFAGSGKALGAEDIKAHFAKMRGDEQAIKDAGNSAKNSDNRTEQSGY